MRRMHNRRLSLLIANISIGFNSSHASCQTSSHHHRILMVIIWLWHRRKPIPLTPPLLTCLPQDGHQHTVPPSLLSVSEQLTWMGWFSVCLEFREEWKAAYIIYWTALCRCHLLKTVSWDSCVAAAFVYEDEKGGTQKYHWLCPHHILPPHTPTHYYYSPDENFTLVIVDSLLPALVCQDFRVNRNNQKDER